MSNLQTDGWAMMVRGTGMRFRWDRILPLTAVMLFWLLAWLAWRHLA